MVQRKSNTKVWDAITQQKDEYIIEVGWFENTTYEKTKKPVGGIAAVQNFGAVIHQTVTDKQRAFLHAIGYKLKKTTQNITIVIPPTHFMENCENTNGEKWKAELQKAWASVFLGNINPNYAMDNLGGIIERDIVKAIIAVNSPPLAKSTVRARLKTFENKKIPSDTGLYKRLNSTGHMVNSVSHKVTKK